MHPTSLPRHIVDRVAERRGRRRVFERIDPARTALIVIDMQNAFMEEGSPSEIPVAREIVPNINRLAEATRRAAGTVVWVTVSHRSDRGQWSMLLDNFYTPEISARAREALIPGSHGHQLWSELDVRPDDLIVPKDRFSAFLPEASELAAILRKRGIDTVIITGTLTNVCCESSARDAMMMDFKTIMVADANACRSDEEHMATLVTVYQVIGDVVTTDETIATLEAGSAAVRVAQ